jgi:hypothetical protein
MFYIILMSNSQIRTLDQYIDSGQDLTGVYFRSSVQITGRGAFVYEVAERPNGEGHFKVKPIDPPLTGDEGYETVEIPYWQHKSDERCESDTASQLAS